MRTRRVAAVAVLACLLATVPACRATDPASTDGGTATDGSTAPVTATDGTVLDVDGRPFTLHVPDGYDPAQGAPLVLGLHGYTSNPAELDSYLGLTAAAEARGFLLALPGGLIDAAGDQYWAAVDGGCCDLMDAGTDDSTYLSHVISAVTAAYRVTRVAVVGHSNGGFMAHRLACDHADQVDAIGSIAGPLGDDPALCRPTEPVTVLHVHGDADPTVGYLGGWGASSAQVTAETWAVLDACAPTPTVGEPKDVDQDLPGEESTVQVWDQGCADGSQVQLWTVVGGEHVPSLTAGFRSALLDVVLAG